MSALSDECNNRNRKLIGGSWRYKENNLFLRIHVSFNTFRKRTIVLFTILMKMQNIGHLKMLTVLFMYCNV